MLNERKISDLYNRLRTLQINAAGDVAVHAALTTTAHGLGASAFHADSYFALALSGTQYRVPRFATASTIGNSPIYTNVDNDKVGIGKKPTALELEVDGGIDCETIKITTGATDGYFLKSDADGNGSWAAVAASQVYKGTWSATTNTPTLADGSGTAGWYYRCVVAGTVDFGSGNITFAVGDDVYYNGVIWQLIPASAYTLPTATASVLGGIKVGTTLKIGSSILDVADDTYAAYSHTHAQLHDAATVSDSASINLSVTAGQEISAVAIFGTTSGTVCEGNDARLSDSRTASDVYAWAKAATKPSYTYSEVGADASGSAATVQGNLTTHAGLTTTAHGLGASAFHADSYFALAGHTHAQLHDAVTLATDSGLSLSTQQIAMGTPGSLNASTTNAVSTSTHTHAVSGFDLAGTTAAHASLTTTAHGLGESAFHADSYFALAGHTHDQLHDSATLATNSGLSLSGQIFSMGTPSTCTAGTSNAVTSATHTHQITGFDPAGTTATHAALTTTAHGLGESAFHADSYFALASHTQNANTIIIPGGVGSPNYDDMQDFLNNTRSAGRIKGGVLTDHSPANGTVDISELEGMIFTTNALGGDLVYFKKAATSAVAITADNAVSWIYYDYTTGSYLSTTDRSTIHEYDQFPVGRVWRGGVYVETLTTGHNIYDKDRRAHNRLIAKYGAMDRSSGAIVFAHATPLRISVTDGSWYTGNTAYSTAATSVFEVWYKSGSATWVESTSLTLFSEVYDGGASKVFETYQNGNNIGTLSANRYGVYWLFVCPEGNLYVVLGTDSYSTIGAAQAASVPSDLPPYCVNWAVMVGKVICQKTAAALYSVESVYSISFTQSTATDHASLSNLNTTSYTHLTAANHTDLTDGGDTTLHTHSTMYSPLNHGVTVGTMPIATSTTAYGDSLFTQDATNILIDPTQTHRIGIGTAIPQHGMLQVNHTQANNQVIPIRTEGLYNCTADSSYDGYAFVGQSEIIISSGKTHSGIINGGYFKSLRKDADDYGHMTNLYGVSSVVGHFTGCQASILTDNASGYISQLFCQVGGITNAYSYIGGAITGTGTVVNFYQFYAGNRGTGYTLTGKAWDFYAVNTGSFNYFAGKTGIGITQPVGRLHVYGGASGLTPTIFTDFIVESNSQVGLNLIAPNASTACYAMGCPGNELMFMLDCNYNSGTETARMFVGGTRIMTMWDSGNMSIGNTTDSGYRVDVSSSIAVRNGATINSIGYDSLGTVSNNELYFKTYNVNKAVLSPAGKFGVGILTGLVGMVDINAGTAGDNLHLKTTDSAGTGIYFRNGFPSTPGLAEINCNYDLDSHSSMIINAAGYHGGTTKKRSLYIGDGAGGTIAYFQASNKYVMIGPLGSYPSYQLDVGNLETTTGYLSSFSQSELATGNSTRIKIGKIATTGNSAYLSYTWLSDNNVSNRFDFGFYGKETTPNLCAYNDGRIVIGSFAPWGSTYGLTVHASSGGDVFVETNAGSGIQLFGTLSGGITNNYLQAVAIGGGTPAFFNLSIGSNIAIKLNESGDTQCNYKFACNGNSPVGKSATATTLAQVITCLQDFGFMS